jgi:hypothetical protein
MYRIPVKIGKIRYPMINRICLRVYQPPAAAPGKIHVSAVCAGSLSMAAMELAMVEDTTCLLTLSISRAVLRIAFPQMLSSHSEYYHAAALTWSRSGSSLHRQLGRC